MSIIFFSHHILISAAQPPSVCRVWNIISKTMTCLLYSRGYFSEISLHFYHRFKLFPFFFFFPEHTHRKYTIKQFLTHYESFHWEAAGETTNVLSHLVVRERRHNSKREFPGLHMRSRDNLSSCKTWFFSSSSRVPGPSPLPLPHPRCEPPVGFVFRQAIPTVSGCEMTAIAPGPPSSQPDFLKPFFPLKVS